MTRWKIWPRQYGKTHQLLDWWLEDPENRVVLSESEYTAANNRSRIKAALAEHFPDWTSVQLNRALRNNLIGWRTWLGYTDRSADARTNILLVAVDDLSAVLPGVFKANVAWGAGVGVNDVPDPAHATQVDDWNKSSGYATIMPDDPYHEF